MRPSRLRISEAGDLFAGNEADKECGCDALCSRPHECTGLSKGIGLVRLGPVVATGITLAQCLAKLVNKGRFSRVGCIWCRGSLRQPLQFSPTVPASVVHELDLPSFAVALRLAKRARSDFSSFASAAVSAAVKTRPVATEVLSEIA